MAKQYGSGYRGTPPHILNRRNAELNPSGQNPDLIAEVGAFLQEADSDIYDALVALEADVFTSREDFVSAMDDLATNYGQGGIAEADIASSLKTWLNANGGATCVTTWEAAFPNCFTSNANLRTAMLGFVSAWTGFMVQWGTMLSGYPTTTQGTFPRVITPRVKSNDLTADYTDMSDWFNALAIPGYGGIQINAAP